MTELHVQQVDCAGATSSSLLSRARNQEELAWQRLVRLYSPLVYRWCRRWGLQPTDAEDVGQAAFAAVARKLSEFRHDRPGDSFRSWLRAVVRSKYLDHLRRVRGGTIGAGGSDAQAFMSQLPAHPEDDEESCELEPAEEVTILYRQAIELIHGEFSERDWRAFHLIVVDEQTPRETAAVLQVSVNTVYLAKSRILRRVREEFEEAIGQPLEERMTQK